MQARPEPGQAQALLHSTAAHMYATDNGEGGRALACGHDGPENGLSQGCGRACDVSAPLSTIDAPLPPQSRGRWWSRASERTSSRSQRRMMMWARGVHYLSFSLPDEGRGDGPSVAAAGRMFD